MNDTVTGTFSYIVEPNDTLWTISQRFSTTIESIIAINPEVNVSNLTPGQVLLIPMANHYCNYGNDVYEGNYFSEEELRLNNYLRQLWEQHIAWTRMVIMDIVYDLPELNDAVNRLLRNPVDFANLFKQYYGDEFAEQFKNLLSDHLVIAAEIVKAAKAKDNEKVEQEERKWYQNADDIAKALAYVNPYWDYEDWKEMLYEHLRLVKEEAVNFLTNNFNANVLLFDDMEKQALEMADSMLEGMVLQFPNQFD